MDDSQRTVLVIEDEPDIVEFLTILLEDHGYRAVFAGNGREGLEAIQTERPDLVSLDINMPMKSGVKVFREMKSDPDLCRIPVVIVTGVPENFRNFISSRRQVPPPEGYISKPFHEAEYIDTIRELIG